MDATTAMQETHAIVNGLMAGLTPEHRDMATPCSEWNVHELVEHMVHGGHAMAGALEGAEPPDETPDFMVNGPVSAWAAMEAHLAAAATDERLHSLHQMPFGEVPGEAVLSIIVADHLTHAWDVAQATGQPFDCSDELATFSLHVWKGLVPAEGRTDGRFGPAIDPGADASPVDQLVGYTVRQP